MWKSSASWSTKRARSGRLTTEAVRTLGFPYSISPTFLQNNQRQTLGRCHRGTGKDREEGATKPGLGTVVYISMAFGNPYGDEWNVDEVVAAVGLLELQEIRTISLADTVGWRRRRRFRKWFRR